MTDTLREKARQAAYDAAHWPGAWLRANDDDLANWNAAADAVIDAVIEEAAKVAKQQAADYRGLGTLGIAASLEQCAAAIRALVDNGDM